MEMTKSPPLTPKTITRDTITLGILGGGQLGRMSAMAAARLGIECVIYSNEPESCSAQVVKRTITADYDDEAALTEFARAVDVITYEFENIPVSTVQFLKTITPVWPDEELLRVSQDRVAEKSYLNAIDIPTARWAQVNSADNIESTLEDWGVASFILKTTRFGYDGKGQSRFTSGEDDSKTTWKNLGEQTLIAEEIIDFDCEISLIIARGSCGDIQIYGPMVNEHKDHILSRTVIPCPLPQGIQNNAIAMAEKLAEAVHLRGVLTLELFVTKDGNIVANEIAPRTHNSGHWSIDACPASQFENHVRAVCGLPLGDATPHSAAEMINLIGDDVHKVQDYMSTQGANVHLYGKRDIRPGRKMGHITVLK
jgi:5-(carboxyamino)imidazole ribonucleotide synthase